MWSIALAILGLLGLYLAGSQKRAGWAVGFIAQFAWFAYAIATGQPGFLLTAVAYAVVYARNWLAWRG